MMQNTFTSPTFQYEPKRLTQAIALEEVKTIGILRFSVSLIGVLMFLFLFWSAFASVEEVAVASGQVVPSGYIQDIQHPEGGVVREILVQEGDLVEKGQPLMRLDATNANADLGQMRARQAALQAQATRLRSFAGNDNNTDHALSPDDKTILQSMEEARTNQMNVARDQIAQKQKELAAATASRQALEKNVGLKRQEYQIYQQTLARGSSSKLMSLTAEQELNQLEGQLKEAQNQEIRAQSAVSEAQNRLQSVGSDMKQDAMKNLGQVEADLAELNKSITKQESAADRTTLTAPVSGIVKGLSVHTIGAVVEAGKLIMEIVPVGQDLVIEALVSPTDIGNVKINQPVKIKVSAFDFSRYGSVPGKVQRVSASTFQDEKGQSFYRARIQLDHNYVGQTPGINLILPGMTVQADIITGQKTVLSYLLKPLNTVQETAFHER